MLTAEHIEQAITPLMPDEQRAQAPALARLLADLAAGERSAESARAEVAAEPALAQALGALGGQEVASDGAVLRFGEGSQLGDVSVRDVAGGNIINLSLPAQIPRRQQIDERRTYGCLGLPIFSITSSRTIISLALTIFFSGALLGGLLVQGANAPAAVPTFQATSVAVGDATGIAATVEAAIAQTMVAGQTAQSASVATALASAGYSITATAVAVSMAQTTTGVAVAVAQTATAFPNQPTADVVQASPAIVAPGSLLESASWLYTLSQPDYAAPLGWPVGPYTPKHGQFILVLLSVVNNTGQAQPLPPGFMVLKDAQGRVWEARPEVSDAYVVPGVNADLGQGQAVPSDGLSRNVALVFDASLDAQGLVLFARGNPGQGWQILP